MDRQREIMICDCTLLDAAKNVELSFREKIELCRLIDRLGVSAIDLCEIRQKKIDRLLIKSICSAVQRAVVAVPVNLTDLGSIEGSTEGAAAGCGAGQLRADGISASSEGSRADRGGGKPDQGMQRADGRR